MLYKVNYEIDVEAESHGEAALKVEVKELSDTERGEGGFGSTGV